MAVTGGGVRIRLAANGAAWAGHSAACPPGPTVPTLLQGSPHSLRSGVTTDIAMPVGVWGL